MKTCIITGASTGIGKQVAIALSKYDYFQNFVLISRDLLKLKNTANEMKSDKNIKIESFDLSELTKIPDLISSVFNKFNSIDALINVAGYAEPQSLLSTSLENIEKTYRINVFAVFMLIRECTKYMRNNDSSKIVNIASTAGTSSRPGWLSYSSSKAALISMTNTLSDELAEYNIKFYTVSPGRCATELRRKLAPDEDQTKIMQPEDVAKVITSLLSPDEQFLDGQNIVIRKKV